MNDKILISNLVVAARIGIFEEEKNTTLWIVCDA